MPNIDHFQLVTNRKGKSRYISVNNLRLIPPADNIPVHTLLRTVHNAVNDFRTSPYKNALLNGLSDSLQNLDFHSFQQIICYGLGNFSLSKSSKYQLAALVFLKSHYNCKIFIYDPMFNNSEIEVLKSFGFDVIRENEEGKRLVMENVSLIFMIHCSTQLTNNFIYANWGLDLQNCVLFSNSWSELMNNTLERNLQIFANYILRIYPYVKEIIVENKFQYPEIFSDSSLHIFTQERLRNIPVEFWSLREEPLYPSQDVEFIKNNSLNS